jgi:hypothetical protein
MSSTTKTPEHVAPAYNLPRGRAVDRGKVAEAAQQTAEAEAPHAAQAAQAAEGWMATDTARCAADRSAMLRFVWLLSLLGRPTMLFNPLFCF